MSKSAVSRCTHRCIHGLGNFPPGLQDFSVTSSLLQQQVVCKELNELTVAGRSGGVVGLGNQRELVGRLANRITYLYVVIHIVTHTDMHICVCIELYCFMYLLIYICWSTTGSYNTGKISRSLSDVRTWCPVATQVWLGLASLDQPIFAFAYWGRYT